MASPPLSTREDPALKRFVGRTNEIAWLTGCFGPSAPRIWHVSGVAGIGKSQLIREVSSDLRRSGTVVIELDCRVLEPSPAGLLSALAAATGAEATTVAAVAARVAAIDEPVLLVLDTYELFWLMDTFIRQELWPALGANVRLLMGSRVGPVGSWFTGPESAGSFRSLVLGPLTQREALAFLTASGMDEDSARLVNAIAHGHPLALTVAAAGAPGRRGPSLADAAYGAVDLLTEDYLSNVTDAITVKGLEASSVVRRTTESLLRAMLPDVAPGDLFQRLLRLPFVEVRGDGLFIHDAVRDGISTRLQARNPAEYRQYRESAWRQLREELRQAPSAALWRYTSDVLYLLQNPVVREGFFPSGFQPLAVEPAKAFDADSVRNIIRRHEGKFASAALNAWWENSPGSFLVCRDAGGSTIGVFVVTRAEDLSATVCSADPIAEAWRHHIGPEDSGRSLLLRRLLDSEEGEANSASRAAFGLDVKRTYMEMRPNLRYIYLCGVETQNFDWCDPLGFQELVEAAVEIDGQVYRTFRLDMGPGSVDSWLSNLVAKEIGIDLPDPVLDSEARELVLSDRRIPLTPLEFGVMTMLVERQGRPVARASLMECVWGYEASTSSNVVEVVVRSIRRKLGSEASRIETVRGTGYRLRESEL